MKSLWTAALLGATIIAAPAMAQTKVAIGISGWTGFAPLTLAKEAGIFAKNGLDVTIKKIPQASRHLAIASGDVQCAATTVETWVVWNANGVATTADSIGGFTIQMVSATFTGLSGPVSFTEHATTPPALAAVTVGDNFFDKATEVVQINHAVTWTWSGMNPHTVSFTGGPESGTPAGMPQTSGTYQRTFTSTGTFSYFCRVHGSMTGSVTVVH